MKIEHIGFTIKLKKEIADFYQDILGMKINREFEIKASMAKKLFNLEKDLKVIQLISDNTMFEVFVNENMQEPEINHLCIAVTNREDIVKSAIQRNYTVTRIERDTFDLIFVADKSGNLFELKEISA